MILGGDLLTILGLDIRFSKKMLLVVKVYKMRTWDPWLS